LSVASIYLTAKVAKPAPAAKKNFARLCGFYSASFAVKARS